MINGQFGQSKRTTTTTTSTTERSELVLTLEDEVTTMGSTTAKPDETTPRVWPQAEPESRSTGNENCDCGCSTFIGMTTESGRLVELMLLGSLVLNVYLAFFPPLFCLVTEMGWLKALQRFQEGNHGGDRQKGKESGKERKDTGSDVPIWV